MPVRTADAVWQGDLRDGQGNMVLRQGAFEGPYSFGSRFESAEGTNPEELIAGAHAGCFSMALSGELNKAGFHPTSIRTTANVHIDKSDAGFTITKIELVTRGEVPNISEADFQQYAETAKKGCPVSRALAAVPVITLEASLV